MKKNLVFILLFLMVVILGPSKAYASQIELKTPSGSVKVGETFNVVVSLSGKEETMGTDLVLIYSPEIIQATAVKEGRLYPVYNPVISKRIDESKGKIILSGSANIGKPVVASGLFATITFKALSPAPALISVDYQKGATDKSGIIDFSGRDLINVAPNPLSIDVKDLSVLEKIVQFIVNLFNKVFPS